MSTPASIKQKYPGVTVWKDRYQKVRYRFQKKGAKATLLPVGLEPFTDEFDAAYRAIIYQCGVAKAEVIAMPNASAPQTFRHGWKLVLASSDWQDLDLQSQMKNERMAKEFLAMPIVPGKPLLWGDVPVREMLYEDLESLKQRWAVSVATPKRPSQPTPSKPWHMKVMLRKIFYIARRRGWRVDDPTELVKWKRGAGKNGGYIGWKTWPQPIREKFEARHPIGTAARTCYAIALWMGNRRGDIASLRWDQMVTEEVDGAMVTNFHFDQQKQVQSDKDMAQVRPLTEMLDEALAPLKRDNGTVLKTAYGAPFSEKSLTGMMAHWCKQAGIEAGYTLHGLRKSYAVMLAESGASYQQQMNMLGHTTPQQVALYAKGVDKRKTTAAAAKLLDEKFGSKRKPPQLRVIGE